MSAPLKTLTPRILQAARRPSTLVMLRPAPALCGPSAPFRARVNQFSTSSKAFAPAEQKREMATVQSGNPLLAAIAEDHQEMYDYYDQYVQNKGNPQAQQKWANQLMWEVARHAVGEELVVYPLMEEHLGSEGKKLADQDRADHQYVKEHLYRLEGMTVGTPEYNDGLKDVMAHLRKHNDSEENNDLPLLTKEIGSDHASVAAASFKRTKKFAPTHAHPSAPDKPPFETLVGLMSAPIDKLKDAFMQFPTAEEKESIRK